jgi:hypothetical protein
MWIDLTNLTNYGIANKISWMLVGAKDFEIKVEKIENLHPKNSPLAVNFTNYFFLCSFSYKDVIMLFT